MNWPFRIMAGLALAGTIAAGAMVVHDRAAPSSAAPIASSPVTDNGRVAGSGIVEASTGTIAVGTPVTGLVDRMDVTWGQQVAKGAPLFRIDARDLLNRRGALVAAIGQAGAGLPAVQRKLDAVSDPRMAGFVTRNDLVQRQSDLAVAQANVTAARAQLHELDAEVARRTVRAPVAGAVLKINVRPGEVAEATAAAQPVLLLGGDDRLYVRVDVDEHDAWRVRARVPGEAFVQGNHQLHAPLRFVRIEPYVQPKTSLTGAAAERTDTRVLQLIYSFDPKALPVYIGQQVDVVLDAPEPIKHHP
ncbi:HlyD family efflux transporter periplasmic adaptor subunit [Sphingomonas koreensis]|nr:HlyD family efflux transporter periplasmic adaptor subunit [Sphingomonas koreensis]